MNSISDVEKNNEPNVFNNYKLETSIEQAKITGLLCVACAIIAVFFVFFGATLSFLAPWVLPLYFVFLLLSAALGLIGYSEIKAIGSGLISSIFLLSSVAFLFVSFLSIPVKPGNIEFGIIYGLFATLIPVMLMVLALITNKVALWKAFLPLIIPILHIFAYPLIGSIGIPLAASLLPLSWGLLGIVAYHGRK